MEGGAGRFGRECEVCLERWRRMRRLPCHEAHLLCQLCLDQLPVGGSGGRAECPFCRSPFAKEAAGVVLFGGFLCHRCGATKSADDVVLCLPCEKVLCCTCFVRRHDPRHACADLQSEPLVSAVRRSLAESAAGEAAEESRARAGFAERCAEAVALLLQAQSPTELRALHDALAAALPPTDAAGEAKELKVGHATAKDLARRLLGLAGEPGPSAPSDSSGLEGLWSATAAQLAALFRRGLLADQPLSWAELEAASSELSRLREEWTSRPTCKCALPSDRPDPSEGDEEVTPSESQNTELPTDQAQPRPVAQASAQNGPQPSRQLPTQSDASASSAAAGSADEEGPPQSAHSAAPASAQGLVLGTQATEQAGPSEEHTYQPYDDCETFLRYFVGWFSKEGRELAMKSSPETLRKLISENSDSTYGYDKWTYPSVKSRDLGFSTASVRNQVAMLRSFTSGPMVNPRLAPFLPPFLAHRHAEGVSDVIHLIGTHGAATLLYRSCEWTQDDTSPIFSRQTASGSCQLIRLRDYAMSEAVVRLEMGGGLSVQLVAPSLSAPHTAGLSFDREGLADAPEPHRRRFDVWHGSKRKDRGSETPRRPLLPALEGVGELAKQEPDAWLRLTALPGPDFYDSAALLVLSVTAHRRPDAHLHFGNPASVEKAAWVKARLHIPESLVLPFDAAAVLYNPHDNKVYIIGGLIKKSGETFVVPSVHRFPVNYPKELSAEQELAVEWETGPYLPQPLYHAAAAVHEGRVVVSGGRLASGAASRDTYRLDQNDRWTKGEAMRVGRWRQSLAVANGRLLAVGGVGDDAARSFELLTGSGWRRSAERLRGSPIPGPRSPTPPSPSSPAAAADHCAL